MKIVVYAARAWSILHSRTMLARRHSCRLHAQVTCNICSIYIKKKKKNTTEIQFSRHNFITQSDLALERHTHHATTYHFQVRHVFRLSARLINKPLENTSTRGLFYCTIDTALQCVSFHSRRIYRLANIRCRYRRPDIVCTKFYLFVLFVKRTRVTFTLLPIILYGLYQTPQFYHHT